MKFLLSSLTLAALVTLSSTPAQACSFDSDCAYGKCRNGKCGACSFDSDCKGHGKCRNGWCQGCSFDSDCAYGKCRNGKCGACSFDSDCKGRGKCRNGWCSQKAAWHTARRAPSLECQDAQTPPRTAWRCPTRRGGPLWGDLVVGPCGTDLVRSR